MKPPQKHHDAIRPLLRRVGLEEKEVEVYLAVLALKVARAAAIAKAAKQSRSNTYLILRSLSAKGLVAEVERGKVIHFMAEPPQRLQMYVQERERELKSLEPLLENIIPTLSGMTKPLTGVPRVSTLKGMEGMRQLYRDALSHEIVGVFNPQAMYDTFNENIVTMLFGKNASLRGRDLFVASEASERFIGEVKQNEDYQVRMLPPTAQFDSDTICFEDTVAFFAYDDELTIVRMENKNIADSFRAWFELMWNMSSQT